MLDFFRKLFGSKHERDVRDLWPIVKEINAVFETLSELSDDQLREKTVEFRRKIDEDTAEIKAEIERLKASLKEDIPFAEREGIYGDLDEHNKQLDATIQESLNEILPEAFAVVKETCRRLVGQTWEVAGNKIVWDMVPFDVQLLGGIVLHQGKIAEMATGEGKTLVATLPTYLNALSGRGVHIVTVNDYLALRDSQWMGKVFEFHGLKIGVILQPMDPSQRRVHYAADITYGTNNEFGFDYLRDNMVVSADEMVQRGHNYAIVDEVDSVLIDEARTPLIISGPVAVDDHKFNEMKPFVERLVNAQKNLVAKMTGEAEQMLAVNNADDAGVLLLRSQRGLPKNKKLLKLFSEPSNKTLVQKTERIYLQDQSSRMHEIDDELYFAIDEKSHTTDLTEKGREFLAQVFPGGDKDMFIIPDIATEFSQIEGDETASFEQKQLKKDEINKLFADRNDRIHTIQQLLRAYCLYEKDDEYVVSDDGKVMIVDEFTGRMLPGRRYSEGLHQAIEAKEGVKVERDTQTLATVTLQNYFRLYKKLAGMTGTAETEAAEFFDIYKLDVVVVPTNQKMVRKDEEDQVYKTKREKLNAVIEEIERCRTSSQPTLVGTTSVEVSETLSRMLKRKGVPHNVLNAKQHQREAEIVAHAGLPGAVTIATNMAGRGTDIKLGPGVKDVGGLHIIGTERHEARRIDRQLRGRSGRQGDPGSSRFYLSLEDDLMRLFGSERIARIMERMGLKEGEVIQHSMITKSVERAQKKVEENNYGIRKRLLEYDNVMNQQREVIYSRRRHALLGEHLRDDIFDMVREMAAKITQTYYPEGDIEGLKNEVRAKFIADLQVTPEEFQKAGEDGMTEIVIKAAEDFYHRKEEKIGREMMGMLERMAMLQVIDNKWRDHLREMDDLKEGIHLRGYGQKDPLVEYKTEAFKMFMELMELITDEVVSIVFKFFPESPEQLPTQRTRRPVRNQDMVLTHESAMGAGFEGNREAIPAGGSEHAQPARPQEKPRPVHVEQKVGRNDPCPCGSGKKYKNCHGAS
ncbi:MAG: preprotein translocase subunit SecA [Ignavibacteria bacterium GWA2_54_16]|nr:MAG: preprotein translocase subunit SecA [Ignavibacteria bacterium GWA2_54_16]